MAAILADQADEPPAFLGVAQVPLVQVTGVAVGQDGETVGIRGADDVGQPVVVTFPASLAGVLKSAIEQGERIAGAERAKAGKPDAAPTLTVAMPEAFHVATAPDFDGVLIVFNPGKPDAQMFGLPFAGAMTIAQHLIATAQKQQASKPRLILPNR